MKCVHGIEREECEQCSRVLEMSARRGGPRTFREILAILRDGRAYTFTTENLTGYFYKAPHPADPEQTRIDGAVSAITYWNKETHERASPTLMLYDFDEDGDEPEWTIEVTECHPARRRRQ